MKKSLLNAKIGDYLYQYELSKKSISAYTKPEGYSTSYEYEPHFKFSEGSLYKIDEIKDGWIRCDEFNHGWFKISDLIGEEIEMEPNYEIY